MTSAVPSTAVPPRLAVLWCPQWPVIAAGAAPDAAVAVLHAMRVVAHSQAAAAAGVDVGMRRREAQSRCPGLHLETHHPDRDARAFERVVRAVSTRVPRLECAEPGTIVFAARSPSRYFGGDESMASLVAGDAASAVGEGLAAVGGVLGAGVADGRFAATVAARLAVRRQMPVVVPPGIGPTAAFLAPLPVQVLAAAAGIDAGFVGLLQRLGLQRLGQLADLARDDVVDRFGPLGGFAHALAAGRDCRLPGTTEPPEGREVHRVFDEPVHHSDALVFIARQMAAELVGALEGLVCTRLVITAETEHGERCERVWYRASGLGVAAMVERVRWQLDAWARDDVLTAGVVLLRLDPAEVRVDGGTQVTLWGGTTDADQRALRAVARLSSVAGEQRVLVPAAAGGRQPHDRYAWVPAALADLAAGDRGAGDRGAGDRGAGAAGPWPGRLPAPSPAVTWSPPLPARLEAADGTPVRVSGRGVLGAPPAALHVAADGLPATAVRLAGMHAVQSWAGPWPLDERWWDARRSRRVARLQVLTADGVLLLLGLERGEWQVWGEYR
ncbi:MAG: DNA polymerase Y family protein [Ilumatobacteraceae bacterium]